MNLHSGRRIVVKIGTSVLVRPGSSGLDTGCIISLAGDIAGLNREGRQIIVVSSGAIGAGMDVLKWEERPTSVRDKQVASAIGQVVLMEAYTKAFAAHGITVGQVLLTREDMNNRERYLNARNTLLAMLDGAVIPVINENDVVATEEIQFGDNDTLAAVVAAKVEADLAIFLTDVDGLYKSVPGAKHTVAGADIFDEIVSVTPEIEALAGSNSGSRASIGGMATKISSAKALMRSGIEMWIANGRRDKVVSSIVSGKGYGTKFVPALETIGARKRWIAFGSKTKGKIIVDSGAALALKDKGKSLLASGIIRVEGTFSPGESVTVAGPDGYEIARGLVYYSSAELSRIKGLKSTQIQQILGRSSYEEVIHRDNMVLL